MGTCDLTTSIYALVFHLVMMMLGVPGNCLILRVYLSKQRKTSTHVLIMGLAWADLLATAFQIFRIPRNCLFVEQTPLVYNSFTNYFLYTAVGTSALLTSVIAFDRYDCVCRPHHRLFSRKRAMIAVACCLATDATVNSPLILEVFFPSGLTSVIILTFQIFAYVSVIGLMIVCYGKVYTTIRKHVKVGVASSISGRVPDSSAQQSTQIVSCYTSEANSITLQCKPTAPSSAELSPSSTSKEAKGEESNPGSSDEPTTHIRDASQAPRGPAQAGNTLQQPATKLERKTTRMLLITGVVFLISWLPYWVEVILSLSDLQRSNSAISPTTWLVVNLASYCVYINHVVNPIIYGLANRRFREECQKELRKLRCW